MTGTWEYRSVWHGLVVGEYSVKRGEDGLQLCEPQSRNGHSLSGTLIADAHSDWYMARLQHGYSCRVQLSTPDEMRSQFREGDGPWEQEVVSRRQRERTSAQALLLLGVSILASGAASVALFGPYLGAGLIGLLLVHELGHIWAMRCYGLPAGPMVFVPFIGAAVEIKRAPALALHEGVILLAGPLFGSCAALACVDFGFTSLGHMGLLVETFNLLPVGALDGGRLLPMLSPWAVPAGLLWGSSLLLLDARSIPAYALLAGFGYAALRGGGAAATARRPESSVHFYEALSRQQRNLLSAGYLSLLFVLTLLTSNRESSRLRADLPVPASSQENGGFFTVVAWKQ